MTKTQIIEDAKSLTLPKFLKLYQNKCSNIEGSYNDGTYAFVLDSEILYLNYKDGIFKSSYVLVG